MNSKNTIGTTITKRTKIIISSSPKPPVKAQELPYIATPRPLAAKIATNRNLHQTNSRSLSTKPGFPKIPEDLTKAIPTPETPIAPQKSTAERFFEGLENNKFDQDILDLPFEAITKLVGATANSTAALILMVPLFKLMLGARNNQPYAKSIQQLKEVKFGQLVQDGYLMLIRRIVASITPAIITQSAGFSPGISTFFNASIETVISGIPKSPKSEPYQRFRSINGSTFDFISPETNLVDVTEDVYKAALKAAIEKSAAEGKEFNYKIIDESILDFISPDKNLATLSKTQYDAEAAKAKELKPEMEVPSYEAFKRSYKRLKVLQDNFKSNILYQTGLLATRNATFSAIVLWAKLGATEFVESFSEVLGSAGFDNKKAVIDALSITIRVFFALATAPIDNALTRASSGEGTFQELISKPYEQFSFRGATARVAFVLCAFMTIAYAKETGEFIKDTAMESDLLFAVIKTMSEAIEEHRILKTGITKTDKEEKSEDSKTLSSILSESLSSDNGAVEVLQFLLSDGEFLSSIINSYKSLDEGNFDSQESTTEIKRVTDLIQKIICYIQENPGLFAGISRADSEVLKRKDSPEPSPTEVSLSQVKTTENNISPVSTK